MADRGDPRSSRAWKKLRASWRVAIATSVVTCRRCGNRITSDQPFDLGHRVALRAGGSNGDVHPEHRACNRAGDAVPAAELTARRVKRTGHHLPPSRNW